MANGSEHGWIADIDKGIKSFRSLADLMGVVKDNVASYFELRDLIDRRNEILKIKELIGNLWMLSNLQAATVLMQTADQKSFRESISEDLDKIKESVNSIQTFYENNLSSLKYREPRLAKDIELALEARLLSIRYLSDGHAYHSGTFDFKKLSLLLHEYERLHLALDELVSRLNQSMSAQSYIKK